MKFWTIAMAAGAFALAFFLSGTVALVAILGLDFVLWKMGKISKKAALLSAGIAVYLWWRNVGPAKPKSG